MLWKWLCSQVTKFSRPLTITMTHKGKKYTDIRQLDVKKTPFMGNGGTTMAMKTYERNADQRVESQSRSLPPHYWLDTYIGLTCIFVR